MRKESVAAKIHLKNLRPAVPSTISARRDTLYTLTQDGIIYMNNLQTQRKACLNVSSSTDNPLGQQQAAGNSSRQKYIHIPLGYPAFPEKLMFSCLSQPSHMKPCYIEHLILFFLYCNAFLFFLCLLFSLLSDRSSFIQVQLYS